jgi:hypothetical protein
MPTPAKGYRLKDGTRVPGTTTILGRFKESGGLIHWSWALAHEPLAQIRAILRNGADPAAIASFLAVPDEASDYRAVRDKAADAGTIAHELVECFTHGRKFDSTPYPTHLVELAQPAFEAFREWADQSHLEIVETEVSLVSERYRFGGTRDAMLIKGKRSLGDYKTSKAIYPEMLLQLAAYAILDEEQGNTIDGGYHLLKFSKQEHSDDPVRFSHHYWSQLDVAREAFLTMRSLYDLMARVGKIAA